MSPTNNYVQPVFNPMIVELSTETERRIFDKYDKQFEGWLDGKVEGIVIKQSNAGIQFYGKKLQSRSAVAVSVVYDREKRDFNKNKLIGQK